jgi:hypothetical protein
VSCIEGHVEYIGAAMVITLVSELNQIRGTLRSWRRLPEFWIITCGSLFFVLQLFLSVTLEMFVFPREAERIITHDGPFHSIIMRSIEIPCRLDGMKIYGYKFETRSDTKIATGVVCWDLDKRRWEWAMDDQEFRNLDSDRARP